MNVKFYSFKRLALSMLVCMLCSISAWAQYPASAYSFSSAAGTYTPLVGGTVPTFGSLDDGNAANIPIGFTFSFCDVPYTQVSICTNGWISFANSTSTTTGNSATAGVDPALMPLFDDISGQGGTCSYLTTGAPGSQVFTVEWLNWTWYYNNSTPYPIVISFQAKMYEATGRIEYVYRQEADPIYGTASATIGIIKSSSDYQTLNNSSATPTSSSSTFTTSINVKPATGQIYRWDPPPPCPSVVPISISNYTSTAASFGWTAAAGGIGYDYAVDENADRVPATATTVASTTGMAADVTGLKPSTRYYIHVRSKCSAVSYSKWDTLSFETRPPCSNPGRILVGRIDSNSVDFTWPGVGPATMYEYLVDTTKDDPVPGSDITSQTSTSVSLAGLDEGAIYYVHYRSLCAGNDSSAWSLDSFRIPVPCRRPELQLLSVTQDNAVVYWDPVKTAVNYEYYVGRETNEPAFGTPIKQNSVQTPYLVPGTGYNIFVKCNCEYYNVKTNSAWSSLQFTTQFPTSVGNVDAGAIRVDAYPNPVADVLHIKISGKRTADARISVTDVAGKQLRTQAVDADVVDLDTKGLPAGVLILHYSDNDNVSTTKIIKQ